MRLRYVLNRVLTTATLPAFRSLTFFQPYLALAKSATSPRAASDLVTRATSDPNTFFFTELLQTPQIEALLSSEGFVSYYKLLEIFSHGTYSVYKSTPDLPPLNNAQERNLRQLSLITLAKDRVLAYSDLIAALGLPSTRELEDLVISAIYANLINATLDPAHETVQIHSVAPLRDVNPNSVPALLSSLRSWSAATQETLSDIELQINNIRQKSNIRAEEKRESEARLADLVEEEKKNKDNESSHPGYSHPAGHGRGIPSRRFGAGVQSAGPNTRYGKRGIGHMDSPEANQVDDEAMDVDDEGAADDTDGKKKRSKWKLQA
jgi:COP9 signalosome complex subunit 7